MADYKKLVQSEAKKFLDSCVSEFDEDTEEHGGNSPAPNFAKWLDRTQKLNEVVEKIVSGWGHKEFQWVKSFTRKPESFGDARSNAFGSFYSDVLHEIKKLRKKSAKSR